MLASFGGIRRVGDDDHANGHAIAGKALDDLTQPHQTRGDVVECHTGKDTLAHGTSMCHSDLRFATPGRLRFSNRPK